MVASPQAPLGSSSHLSSKYQSSAYVEQICVELEYRRDRRCWNHGSQLSRLRLSAQLTWLLEGVSQLSRLGLACVKVGLAN
jgi:hypothetical protein